MWTTERALEVYTQVFPDDPIKPGDGDCRESDIVAEMNAVKFADTAKEGAAVIEWWEWDEEYTALDAAIRIRRFKA